MRRACHGSACESGKQLSLLAGAMITPRNESYRSRRAATTEIHDPLWPVGARILGGRAEAIISEGVQRRIKEQQAAREIIVGWIQAGIVAFFAVVYAISPKASHRTRCLSQFPGPSDSALPWKLSL